MSNPAMVSELNELVASQLLTERVLCLPGIGTLRVERVGAKRLTKRMIVPPRRIVSFSSKEEGEPFSAVIARAAGCDEAQGLAAYERWRSCVFANGILTLEGVGVLRQKHFRPDPAFDKVLNPYGYAPMQVRSRRRFDWVLAAGAVAILFAAGFGGYQFLQMLPDSAEELPESTKQTVSGPVAAEPADTLAEVVVPAAKSEGQPVAEVNDAAPQTQSASGASAVEPQPSAEHEGGAAVLSETGGAAARVANSEAAASAEEPGRLVSGRRYVVLGVFSTPENAGRAATAAEKRMPGVRCMVYVFGQKWMVSPFEAEDASACSQFVNEYRDRLPDLWVYTAR